jgi:hypothetical protein
MDRGYVSALNNLAVMYELGEGGVQRDPQMALDLLKRGAEQGHPLAMYNLGVRYRYGRGIKRNWGQAYELLAKAAETGLVSAMVELGDALVNGVHIDNPRRGVDWLQRAADAGAARAKSLLGNTYYWGSPGKTPTTSVMEDKALALLWFGRMGESADPDSLRYLAQLMQSDDAMNSPQPEVAERYWRLAAYGGNAYAQVYFAERMRRGFLLAKQEYGPREAVELLDRAASQGSAEAQRGARRGQEPSGGDEVRLSGNRTFRTGRVRERAGRAISGNGGCAFVDRNGEERRSYRCRRTATFKCGRDRPD